MASVPSKEASPLVIRCACGQVEFRAFGEPITSLVCYCDDCQEGAKLVESLPDARPVMDADGGSAVVLYRRDHVICTAGQEFLKPYKVRDASHTNRIVTACCNAAIMLSFEGWRPWVSVYREAIASERPRARMRIFTKFAPQPDRVPRDVRRYSTFPLWFPLRMLFEWVAMALRPRRLTSA